jgi:RNA ligase
MMTTKINVVLLLDMVHKKYINVQKHPTADLWLYNYSKSAQYEGIWNECTRIARGLILDKDYNTVSRPFPKFFNMEEHTAEEIPNLSYTILEKLDGSLGIMYWIGNTPFIATRGSFNSEQAMHATRLLHTRHRHLWKTFNRETTYLFEIIYPENRIVITYEGKDDIVLLAKVHNETGDFKSIWGQGFDHAKEYKYTDFQTLKNQNFSNKEGYVIRFSNNFMMKIKFEEYVRLHRILTGVTSRLIWEYLRDGTEFNEILNNVPDEFYDWVKLTKKGLTDRFKEIKGKVYEIFDEAPIYATRKEIAEWAKTKKGYTFYLFKLLDLESLDPLIWKNLKPKHETPFMEEHEINNTTGTSG